MKPGFHRRSRVYFLELQVAFLAEQLISLNQQAKLRLFTDKSELHLTHAICLRD